MYNVMIIDDEQDVREHLASIIDWKNLPVVLVAAAADVDTARELYLTKHPQIIITDINLTMGSGLDLIDEFLKDDPSLQCIIITGYNEFAYAQRALRMGAIEFLLKPIFPEAINLSIEKAVKHFDSLREKETSMENLKKLLEENRQAVCDAYLGRLLRQESAEITTDEVLEKFRKLGIPCPGPQYAVALLSLPKDIPGTEQETACLLVQEQVSQILEENNVEHYLFFDSHFRLTCLASSRDNGIDAILEDCLQKLVHRITVIDHITLYAGISQSVTGAASLGAAFYQAKTALSFINVLNDDTIISYKNISMYESAHDEGHTIANELKLLFLKNNYPALRERLVQHMEKLSEGDLSPLRSFVFDVIATISGECSRQGISINDLMASREMLSILSDETAEDIQNSALSAVYQLTKLQEQHFSTNSNHLINLAKDYIAENYARKDLNLETTSEAIGLSKSYFCDLFHRTESVSFSNYLTDIRIKKAQQLLKNSGMRISEVADSVGFGNVKYFCYVFKKHTGMSPSEFQDS